MKNVPDIRFKGFDEEWKICQLKQFAFKVTRKNCDKEFTKTFTNSAEFGVINQNEYFDRTISNSENIGGYYVVENNDYIYNPRVSTLAPVGPINRNKLGYTGVVSPLYLVFKVNNIDKDYLDVFFNTNLWHRYMKLEGNCGARFDRLSISDELFFEMPIILPSNEAEQYQIASYFRQLYIQISEQEKILEKLKQLKSACLISMFPQQGETVPRVRFKGFDGEWNEQKAENIFRQFIEKNRPDLPVLSATQDRGMVTRKAIGYDISHDKRNECTYKHILPGQFVIHLRSFQGGFAHSDIEGIASPAYTVFEFRDKNQHNDIFWKYIFSSKSFIKQLEKITYGIRDGRSISFDEFKDMKFIIPCVKEQHQIASYFRNLDIQISEQEKRLEKLKQIKAACLDKMFV